MFGRHGVSIRSMEQEGSAARPACIFITHSAVERDVQATLHDLRELDVVDRVGTVLRVTRRRRRLQWLDFCYWHLPDIGVCAAHVCF